MVNYEKKKKRVIDGMIMIKVVCHTQLDYVKLYVRAKAQQLKSSDVQMRSVTKQTDGIRKKRGGKNDIKKTVKTH